MRPFVCALLAMLGCGGQGDTCRTSRDCQSGLECSGPNDGPVCGIAPRRECTTDGDCNGGGLCHAVDDPCSPSGIGTACGPPCTSMSCTPGLRCAARGACEPIPCDAGWSCRAYERCDPTAVAIASHGCVRVSCTSDGSCPSGQACVNGLCQEHAGQCRRPELVP